jgi:hypothetical protein
MLVEASELTAPRPVRAVTSAFAAAALVGMVGCADSASPRGLPADGGPNDDGAVLRDAGVACERIVNRVDRDGDGYLVNDPSAPPSCGDIGSSGDTPSFDCDDADPTVYLVGYRDEDEDFCVLPSETKCIGRESGYVVTGDPASRRDCNDRDAALCYPHYTDADGDGFGSPTPLCVPAALGLAIVGGDCDDSDPNVQPGATELGADGVDSDCDGVDGDSCIDPGSGPPVFSIDTSCLGPDLFIASDGYCRSCGAVSYSFIVGNRGTAVATGLLSLEGSLPPDLAIPIDLAPGDVLPVITFNPGSLSGGVDLRLDGVEECTLENNEVWYSFTGCP